MKTLIVKYTPREESSRTRDLLDYFKGLVFEQTTIEQIDLADDIPQPFTRVRLMSYYRRNYQEQELSSEELDLLAQMDSYVMKLQEADVLVIACPVYMFSVPAIVKGWIEGALQRGVAYDVDPNQGVVPQLTHLKVLCLYTAGIVFDSVHGTEGWNGVDSLIHSNFTWVGANDIRVIGVEGLDMFPQQEVKLRIEDMKIRLHDVYRKWYRS